MPIGHKSPSSLAAEIKMTRMIHSGSFLVVEGVSDKRFWTLQCQTDCEIVDGEGKENILGCIRLLDRDNFAGVLGIVDNDGDVLLDIIHDSENIAVTDSSDFECMLLRSSAFDTILVEYGAKEKIMNYETSEDQTVREGLLDRALIFGALRLAARQSGIDIKKHALTARRYVSESHWSVSKTKIMEAACEGHSADDTGRLRRCINRFCGQDPWQVVRGHDMVEILRIGLKLRLGNLNNSTGVKEIKRVLRAAISPVEIQATALWQQIRDWENNNEGYPILR